MQGKCVRALNRCEDRQFWQLSSGRVRCVALARTSDHGPAEAQPLQHVEGLHVTQQRHAQRCLKTNDRSRASCSACTERSLTGPSFAGADGLFVGFIHAIGIQSATGRVVAVRMVADVVSPMQEMIMFTAPLGDWMYFLAARGECDKW